MTSRWRSLIETAAERHGVPPDLVEAIVHVESGGDPWAMRYEPGYRWLVSTNHHGGTQGTETEGQKISWGLGQIMGATAREMGYAGKWLSGLCDPATNLEYVATFLSHLLRRYNGDISDAIAAYNAGGARKDTRGQYRNQVYVNRVLNYLEAVS